MHRWRGEWPAGWHVEHVAETASTNADLLETAAHRPHRSVLATDHQTAGRGRLDRRWDAPPGANLLVSLLFHEAGDAAPTNELVRRVSLAAVVACRHRAPVDTAGDALGLKWPNDLLLDGRKLAGVLAERRTVDAAGGGVVVGSGHVVVGIGINVGWAPEGAARLGDGVDRRALLAALLSAYDRLPADAGELHARYRSELTTLGQRVRVELPTGAVTGQAVDVDLDGRLVVLDDGAIAHSIDAGDVTHLRRE